MPVLLAAALALTGVAVADRVEDELTVDVAPTAAVLGGLTALEAASSEPTASAPTVRTESAVPEPVSLDPAPSSLRPDELLTSAALPNGDLVLTLIDGAAAISTGASDPVFELATTAVGDLDLRSVDPVIAEGDGEVSYDWGVVTEWYRTSGTDAVEHGYTIDEPVSADAELVVTVDIADGVPTLVDGDTVAIERADGSTVWYRGLVAFDDDGADLAAEMNVTDGDIELVVDTAGAEYPITIDPDITAVQRVEPDLAGIDLGEFGNAVDIDGSLAIVADPGDGQAGPGTGAATVYRRSGSTWVQEAKLVGSVPFAGFGTDVAISDGLRVTDDGFTSSVEGGLGSAAFDEARCPDGWALTGFGVVFSSQNQPGTLWPRTLEPECTPIVSRPAGVQLDLTRTAPGPLFNDPASGGPPDFPPAPGELEQSCPAGSVVVSFSARTGGLVDGIELQCAELEAAGTLGDPTGSLPAGFTADLGPFPCPTGFANGFSGTTGDDINTFQLTCAAAEYRAPTAYVGAPFDDANGADSGAVHAYEWNGAVWQEEPTLSQCLGGGCDFRNPPTGSFAGYEFGSAVDLDDVGSTLAIGVPGAQRAYLTRVTPGSVVEEGIGLANAVEAATGLGFGDLQFGAEVAVDPAGTHVAVGAPDLLPEALNPFEDLGTAYVFDRDGGVWPLAAEVVGTSPTFGSALAMDERFTVVGQPPEPDGTGPGAGFLVWDNVDGFELQREFRGGSSTYGSAVAVDGGVLNVGLAGEFSLPDNGGVEYWELDVDSDLFEFRGNVQPGAGRAGTSLASSAGIVLTGSPTVQAAGVREGSATFYPTDFDNLGTLRIVSPTPTGTGSTFDVEDGRAGFAVDVDGNRMAASAPTADVGAPGAGVVHLYERDDAASPWQLKDVVVSPDPEPNGWFGDSVAISGNLLAVGESDRFSGADEPGRVHVYVLDSGDLAGPRYYVGEESAGASGDRFGASMDWVINVLAVGAPGADADAGASYRVDINGLGGQFVGLSLEETTPPGLTLQPGDEFGSSIAVAFGSGPTGLTAVIGAPGAEADGGAVHLLDLDSGTGDLVGRRTFAGLGGGRRVGTSAAIDGRFAVVGGYGATMEFLVFEWSGSEWIADIVRSAGPNTGFEGALPPSDYLDIDGGTVAIGVPGSGGAVALFRFDGESWPSSPDHVIAPAEREAGDRIGRALALSRRTLVVGAPGDDGAADDVADAGAVYSYPDLPVVATYQGTFDAGNSNTWNDPVEWDVLVVPGPGDTAIVPSSGLVTVESDVEIGRLVMDTSTLSVGAGQVLTSNDTVIRGSGEIFISPEAELVLRNQAEVDGFIVAAGFGDEGLLTLDGAVDVTGTGELDVPGDLTKVGAGTATVDVGDAPDPNAGFITGPTTNIGVLEGTLALTGADLRVGAGGPAGFAGEAVAAAGAVLAVDGDLAPTELASLGVDIAGDASSTANYGQIQVSGTLTKAGGLFVNEVITPAPGQTYPIVTCGDCTPGAFSSTPPPPFVTNVGPMTIEVTYDVALTFDNDTGNGLWSDPLNWSSDAVPGPDDDVVIPPGPVVVDDDFSVGSIDLAGGLGIVAGNLTLTGGPSGDAVSTIQPDGLVTVTPAGGLLIDGPLSNGGLVEVNGAVVSGSGSFTNEGTFRSQATTTVNVPWTSATGSVIGVDSGSLTITSGYEELGLVQVAAGATLTLGGSMVFDDPSTLQLEIVGPSSSPLNSGRVVIPDAVPQFNGDATLRVDFGEPTYVPTETDEYVAIDCGTNTCPVYAAADTAPLAQSLNDSGDLVLSLPAPSVNTFLAGSGAWTSPGNWSEGVVPGPGDAAVIPDGSVATIGGGEDLGVGALTLDGTLSVSGTLQITADSTVTPNGLLRVVQDGLVDLGADLEIQRDGSEDIGFVFTFEGDGESGPGTIVLNDGAGVSGDGNVATSGVVRQVASENVSIGPDVTWNSGTNSLLDVRSGVLVIEPEFFGYQGEIAVAAGAAVEILGLVTLVDSSVLAVDIAGSSDDPADYGRIRLATSDLNADGTLRVVTTGAEPDSDDEYPIITCDAGDCASGTFDTLDVGALSVERSPGAVVVRGSDPTLSLSISTETPTAQVGVSSISVADLPASVFQGYGGTASDYATSSIETLDLRADLGAPGGGATPVADVTLADLDLATTPITRRLLRSILLPEIPITGGWAARLQPPGADTVLVEQSLSLLEIYDDYPQVAADVTLGELGLEASNLGSISTYAALLAGVSVDQLPVPGGEDAVTYWCGLVADAQLSCADDFGVLASGSGISNLTLPVLSFAGIDIEQADLLGTPLVDETGAGVDLSGTPIGENALQDLNLGVVPLASQPLVPSKALPSFLPSTVGVPAEFADVSFGELAGATPLAALQPADVGLDGVSLSELDLAAQPESPLVDYQYAPKSVGASLLLTNEDDELPDDLAAVTVKDLGTSAPILSLPLEELILPNGRSIGSYRLDELFVDSAPFGVSPFGVSPFGVSPFGVSPFGVSPFGVSPFGVSPFGVSPFGVSPFGVSPFGVSPLSDLGLAAPVTALPLDDVTNPVGGKALGDYRLDELDSSNLLFDLSIQPFVGWDQLDCSLVDCRQPNGFTIGDALAAGALPADLTLGDVQLGLAGLTVADLIGANQAFTETALTEFVASITLTVREAEALGLGVQGIPIQLLSSFGSTTIQEARLLFSGYSLIDIGGLAIGLETADVEAAIDDWNGRTADGDELTLGDLTRKIRTDEDGLGDRLWVDNLALSTVADKAPQLEVDDVWPLLTPLRVEHLVRTDGSTVEIAAGASQRTIGSTIGTSSELDVLLQLEGLLWGDVVGSSGTDPVPTVRDVTVADVVDDFQGITLGEFLRAAQPISDQTASGIDLSAVDLADYSTDDGVTYVIDVELGGTARTDGLRLVATLPEGGRYIANSASLATVGGDPSDSTPLEPSLFGDTLVWQLTNVQPDTPYAITFGVRSPAQVGIVTASARGQLLNSGVIAQSQTAVEYVEAFEPNNVPEDAGVITIEPGQIVLSQISTATDVDLFRFEIDDDTVGTRVGATLSSLPADFDLTIIGPSAAPLSPTSGRVIDSVGDSQLGVTGGAAASTLADAGQYQPPSGFAVIARSTGRGTSTEQIDPSPLFVTGTYYLVVSGYNGARSERSYALEIEASRPNLEPAVCPAGASFPFAGQGTTPTLPPIPADVDTLFVVNHRRFGDQYGAAAAQEVLDEIATLTDSLASDPDLIELGLTGATLDLGAVQEVSDEYAAWDAAPCDLTAVNDVARSISSVLADTYRTYPGIENVVVVGSDRIVPFARLADRTLLGNEQDYALTFGDDLSSPLYATLSAGTFLSDDPYADTTPRLVNDRALYVPERAIGRLVEDPASIVGQLRSFVEQDGRLRTDSGLVTGYDFVTDSSELIAAGLTSDPGDGIEGPVIGDTLRLINDTWNAQELDAVLFPQDAPAAGIGSVNGHFSHQGTQSAFGSENDVLDDAVFTTDIGTTDFTGSLIYTLGCHSGLSVSEEIGGPLGVDWAEALGRAGAGAYVAQTGFGYGSSNSVQLTETLMVDFTELLDGNFSVGEALTLAKNEYYASLGAISVYDEKSTQQAVLYGLPFAVPDVADPAERPQPPARLPLASTDTAGLATGVVDVDVEVTERQTPDGTLFEIDGRSYAPQEQPLQPITSADATGPDIDGDGLPDQRLHGALLTGGVAYLVGDGTGPAVIDPVYQTPTINDSDNEPELQPSDAVYPISPLSVSDSLTEFGVRDFVAVQPGRFRATRPDGSGEQALYDELSIQTLHSNSDDWDAPRIGSVQQTVSNGQLSVSITAPNDDVAGVTVAVLENLGSSSPTAPVAWRSFELAPVDAGGTSWSGAYTLTADCTEQLEYLIQIYDAAGNVRVMSNKAGGFQAACEDEPTPEPDPALSAAARATNLDPGGSGWYIGAVTIDVTTTLPGPLSYRIDGGPSTPLTGTSFEIVGNGTRRFTVTAAGSDLVASGVVRIDAGGTSPVVTISSPAGDVDAGTNVPIVFSCTDPSRISCEGELTAPDGSTSTVTSGSRVTAIAGTYVLTVTSDDAVTGTPPTTAVRGFTARATAPDVIRIGGPAVPSPLGTASVIDVEFTDAELASDEYTVEFDFGTDPFGNQVSERCVATSSGPGTTADAACSLVAPTADTPGTATATIVFPETGVYSVRATVTDAAGLESSATYEFVVVFDPGGGRVAGSGAFWSDAASSLGDGPRWGTIGLFGYNARYRNAESPPVGRTSLKLLGGLRFDSTDYDYLVINDTIAVTEGSGSVNGESGYRMRVQGIDNGWLDFFQITIWDPFGELVYDNGILYEDPPDDLRDDRGDVVLLGGIRIRK